MAFWHLSEVLVLATREGFVIDPTGIISKLRYRKLYFKTVSSHDNAAIAGESDNTYNLAGMMVVFQPQ